MKPVEKNNNPSSHDRHRWIRFLYLSFFYVFLLLLISPVIFRKAHANDLWKALYSGRYLAMFGQFPNHSTFAFSPTVNFLTRNTFNWLGNLSFYGLQTLGGVYAQQGLRCLVILFALVLLHSLMDFDSHPFCLLILVFVTYGIIQKTHLRTALFAVPFTSLLMWIWYQVYYKGHSLKLYYLPLLFLLWSNIHGSYIVGLGILSLLIIGAVLNLITKKEKPDITSRLLIVFGLIFAIVVFVKPFPDLKAPNLFSKTAKNFGASIGVLSSPEKKRKTDLEATTVFGMPEEASNTRPEAERSKADRDSTLYQTFKATLRAPFQSGGRFRSAEYLFPLEHTQFLFVRSSLLIIVPVLLSFLLVPFPLRWDLLVGSLGITLLGLGYLRTVGYISLVIVPCIIMRFNEGDFRELISEKTVITSSITSLLGIWILSGNLLFLIYTDNLQRLTGNPHHTIGAGVIDRFDSQTADLILRNYPDEDFYNAYNIGSFLIWKWWPHKKVFLDSKFSAFESSFQQRLVNTRLPEFLKELQINHGVMTISSVWSRRYFLPSSDWALIHQNKRSLVFKRNNPIPSSD